MEEKVEVQPEPEVVKPARIFTPKKCKAEGCENIFTPTVGYQTYCPDHRADRERTKRSRERTKAREEAEAQRLAALTRDEFWDENRKKLKKSERERLEKRTEEIFLFLCVVMDDYISGTDGTTEQDLQDTIAEVAAEVAQYGVCDLNVALIEWWKPWEKDFYDAVVAKGGATEKFVKFGYIDAISSDVYHRFASKFMQKPPTNPTVKAEWVTLTCTTPGCGQGLAAMPRELANDYAARGIKPFCYRCIDLERKSAAQAAIFTEPAAKIREGFGRIDHWRKDV